MQLGDIFSHRNPDAEGQDSLSVGRSGISCNIDVDCQPQVGA